MDAANVDLKGFTEDFYRHVCGGHLQDVLDTLVYLKHETDVWFETTTLLIPGKNDSDEELDAMTRWVVENLGNDVPMHFTAFHPDFKMLDTPATPPSTLVRAHDIAKANGVRHAYTGNVHDRAGGSTYCHQCNALLIERDWYQLGKYHLTDDGHCEHCGTQCNGRFDGPAARWGARRVPVRLADFRSA
jgi:pyruvate formate lyase activating enzyme